MNKNNNQRLCLVTGVTGYIGGRLVPWLLERGYRVRVLTRDIDRLQGRGWIEEVEVVEADVLNPETLPRAMQNVDVAYYLIHSMSGTKNESFHERDMEAARNFGKAASEYKLDRIIYLGGLGNPEDNLSKHLRSRQKTGECLREFGVPVTEFRAAIVVGSGSKSFEMMRYLTDRVPVMICPKWVYSKVQPIAIRNILQYLVEALDKPETKNEIIQIGGKSVITYAEMMQIYARINNLKRFLIPVPLLSPRLSSYWVHWVTPIPSSLAQPLIQGLKNDVVVYDDKARKFFPDIELLSYEEAVKRALDKITDPREVETTWNDALLSSKGDERPVELETKEGLNIERRFRIVEASPEKVFKAFTSLGGEKGWLTFEWAWKLRGIADRMVGGVGFRRGRRDPNQLRVGDALDFWRVEAIRTNRLLRLRAEMKVPGRAWLEFQSMPDESGRTKLVQTAYFAPKGLPGLLYWYALYPLHSLIFSSMIEQVAKDAENFTPARVSTALGE
ncbi:MAG: SDR family oxidoreductase [Balneolaceae bacterium]|nr:SDR family oxidoreductase [Balneolaceae bacterium]